MVDVTAKHATKRSAKAGCEVYLPDTVLSALGDGEGGLVSKKGSVFATAIVAGVMAAKRTHELIPFCHPLGLTGCDIDIRLDAGVAVVTCECRVEHKTGVEMEALTGASVAALTIYDMCKAVAHDIRIDTVRLIAKTGGKADYAAD